MSEAGGEETVTIAEGAKAALGQEEEGTKRVWKPLELGPGLRLYSVRMRFPAHPVWNREFVVMASSPAQAAELVEKTYEGTDWLSDPPLFTGWPLDVYQPEDWQEMQGRQDQAGQRPKGRE